MTIKAIFAVDYWGGMGQNGSLPWPHHSEDLQYFKQQTKDQIVVMGRRTWDDPKMLKPLSGRQTFVATTKPLFDKIRDMFDIVFFISHNDLVKDWADNIITVTKEILG